MRVVPFRNESSSKILIFFLCHMNGFTSDFNSLGIKVNQQPARLDHRLRMAFRAPDDYVNARNKLAFMKGLRQIIIGAESKATNLVLHATETRENKNRRLKS